MHYETILDNTVFTVGVDPRFRRPFEIRTKNIIQTLEL